MGSQNRANEAGCTLPRPGTRLHIRNPVRVDKRSMEMRLWQPNSVRHDRWCWKSRRSWANEYATRKAGATDTDGRHKRSLIATGSVVCRRLYIRSYTVLNLSCSFSKRSACRA